MHSAKYAKKRYDYDAFNSGGQYLENSPAYYHGVRNLHYLHNRNQTMGKKQEDPQKLSMQQLRRMLTVPKRFNSAYDAM